MRDFGNLKKTTNKYRVYDEISASSKRPTAAKRTKVFASKWEYGEHHFQIGSMVKIVFR